MTIRRKAVVALWALALLVAAPAGAAPAPAAVPQAAAPDSPRAALEQYLLLCRAGRHGEAARYLEPPADRAAAGPALARRLKAVLDRHVWFDLALVSPPRKNQSEPSRRFRP